jgi:hypothetical protein
MPLQAQRTLVKSQPELWAEVSDAAALARHLGELGEIRITRVEAERAVEWEASSASGKLELEPSGWGTRVTVTAQRPDDGLVVPAEPLPPEPPPTLVGAVAALMATGPAAEPPETEEQITEETEAVPEAPPDTETQRYRARWWSRWRRSWRAPEVPGEAMTDQDSAAEAEPETVAGLEPAAPALEPAPAVAPEPAAEPEDPELLGVLTGVLDSLGTAHHRPFSRP